MQQRERETPAPSSKSEALRSLTRVKAKLAALVASPALTRVRFVQGVSYEGMMREGTAALAGVRESPNFTQRVKVAESSETRL